MKEHVNFKKVYQCLDDECKFIIDQEVSTVEHDTVEMPLTRKTIELKDLQIEEGNDNIVTGYISTRDMDWSGDIVIPEGVMLEVYQKNPIVLFNHDTTKVIGKCINLVVEAYGIKASVEFAPTDEAQDFKKLAKGGFISAFSVGFIPIEFVKSNEKSFKTEEAIIRSRYPEYKGGAKRIIKKFFLLEFSLVATPDNPNAIITQKQINELELKSSTIELLKLNCSDCEEASKELKDAIIEYKEGKEELALHEFTNVDTQIQPLTSIESIESTETQIQPLTSIDRQIRVIKLPEVPEVKEEVLVKKRELLEKKMALLVEAQERKNKQLEANRLEAILTKKGKLVRY